MNNQIRAPKIRLIDEKGKNKGVMARDEAMALAKDRGLDLVEVQPNAKPPVVKLLDFAKYRYQLQKAARKGRPQKTKVKGVRFSLRTDEHDLQTKAKQASRFLAKGHKVRVQLFLKGREKGKRDLAQEKLKHFLELIEEPAAYEQPPKRHPMGMVALLRRQ